MAPHPQEITWVILIGSQTFRDDHFLHKHSLSSMSCGNNPRLSSEILSKREVVEAVTISCPGSERLALHDPIAILIIKFDLINEATDAYFLNLL
jgi:hypothetical protein